MSSVSDRSSSAPHGTLRSVGRCCPSTQQTRRSDARIMSLNVMDTAATPRRAQKFVLCTSDVSPPSRLLEDQLVERQVRSRTTKPAVLLLPLLHPPSLVDLQASILLAPPVIGLLRNANPATCLRRDSTLPQHDLRLTQLADNLLRLVPLRWRSASASLSIPSSGRLGCPYHNKKAPAGWPGLSELR